MKVKRIENYQPNQPFLDSLNQDFAPLAMVAAEEVLGARGISATVAEVKFVINPATIALRATHFGFENSWTTPVVVRRGDDGKIITKVEVHPAAITDRALAMMDAFRGEREILDRFIERHEGMSEVEAKRIMVGTAGLGLLAEMALINVTGEDITNENEALVDEVKRRTGELWRIRR